MPKLNLPDEDWIVSALRADDLSGWCVRCGAEAGPVEPDARNHVCECCGERGVFGAEELLIRGAYTQSPERE